MAIAAVLSSASTTNIRSGGDLNLIGAFIAEPSIYELNCNPLAEEQENIRETGLIESGEGRSGNDDNTHDSLQRENQAIVQHCPVFPLDVIRKFKQYFSIETKIRNQAEAEFRGLRSVPFDVILKATQQFSDDKILGNGQLDDGELIAVKRLSRRLYGTSDDFIDEIALLSYLQHKNVVKILGYCIERDEQLLIYEFISNRSLADVLFGERTSERKKLEPLVDCDLQGNYIGEEVEELIEVALLCTQNTAMERPKMSKVVRMIEGDGLSERWEEWQKEEIFRPILTRNSSADEPITPVQAPTSKTGSSADGENKVWVPIVVTVSAVVAVVLFGVFAWRMFRRHRKIEEEKADSQEIQLLRLRDCRIGNNNNTYEGDQNQMESQDLPLFPLELTLEATQNFSDQNKLGEGGFGSVYKRAELSFLLFCHGFGLNAISAASKWYQSFERKVDSISNDLCRDIDTLRVVTENLRIQENRAPPVRRVYVSLMGACGQRRARRHVQPAPPEFSESDEGGIRHQRYCGRDSSTDEEVEQWILGKPRFAAQPSQFCDHQNPIFNSTQKHHHNANTNEATLTLGVYGLKSQRRHELQPSFRLNKTFESSCLVLCKNSSTKSNGDKGDDEVDHSFDSGETKVDQEASAGERQTFGRELRSTPMRKEIRIFQEVTLERELGQVCFDPNPAQQYADPSQARRDLYIKYINTPTKHNSDQKQLKPSLPKCKLTSLIDMIVSNWFDCEEISVDEITKSGNIAKIERDLWTWNSMIAGYVSNGVLDLDVEMLNSMRLDGFELDVVTWNTVMDAYCRMGLCDEAWKIFKHIKEPSIISWTTLISGYSRIGKHEVSSSIFRDMMNCGASADSNTLSSVPVSCRHLGALMFGKEIHSYGVKAESGIGFYGLTGLTLLTIYAKPSRIQDAKRLALRDTSSVVHKIIGQEPVSPVEAPPPVPNKTGGTDLGRNRKENRAWIPITISLLAVVVVVLLGSLIWQIRRRNKNKEEESNSQEVQLLRLREDLTLEATQHFSEENKLGEGGFGPVYKGILADDFGMARIFGEKQSEANTIKVVGTYGYMAPEYAMEEHGLSLLNYTWKLCPGAAFSPMAISLDIFSQNGDFRTLYPNNYSNDQCRP
ncbi:hypothetical protein LWI28_001149 [Acer negundo]|uniref:Tyrosine-protein kinase catalytic domain-containing protein n=1 Tax=Acer negundo TaxID=4023 RepID=A0AAD5P4M9_ACENE|nr:hypothetical protein LWI28_001149 [Acer negundo]